MQCQWAQPRLDDHLDGELTGTFRDALSTHIAQCEICAAELARRETLRDALRQLPLAGLRPGFTDEALHRAAAAHAALTAALSTQTRDRNSGVAYRRREFWWGAALSAAASVLIVIAVLMTHAPGTRQPPQGVTLIVQEIRDVGVMIESDRVLAGATITVRVPAGFTLAGFTDQQEIHWQTDLERGSNLLWLPVIADAAGDGELVAIVAHEGRSKRVAIRLTARDTPSATRAGPNLTGGLS